MITKIISAFVRALSIAVVFAIPSLWVPSFQSHSSQLALAFALFAGAFVFFEYIYDTPTTLEFTSAAPYNRIRFIWFTTMVLFAAGVFRTIGLGLDHAGPLSAIATILGHGLNIPYSPVQLVSLMVPPTIQPETKEAMLMIAGLGYIGSWLICGGFYLIVRFTDWPKSNTGFNVWKNLPLLDPTSGKDIVVRLVRDARVNISLGIIAPFAIPAMVKIAFIYTGTRIFANPETLVWIMVGWSVIPASLIMRGTAMLRIATMIAEKRQTETNGHTLQPA